MTSFNALFTLALNAPACKGKSFAQAQAWANYMAKGLKTLGYHDLATKVMVWIERGQSDTTTSGIKWKKADNSGVIAPEQLFCNLKVGAKRSRHDVARAFALAVLTNQDYNPDRFESEFSEAGLTQGLQQFNRENTRKHKAELSADRRIFRADEVTANRALAAHYESRHADREAILNRYMVEIETAETAETVPETMPETMPETVKAPRTKRVAKK